MSASNLVSSIVRHRLSHLRVVPTLNFSVAQQCDDMADDDSEMQHDLSGEVQVISDVESPTKCPKTTHDQEMRAQDREVVSDINPQQTTEAKTRLARFGFPQIAKHMGS